MLINNFDMHLQYTHYSPPGKSYIHSYGLFEPTRGIYNRRVFVGGKKCVIFVGGTMLFESFDNILESLDILFVILILCMS